MNDTIKIQQELIQLLENQIMDLVMMSKIELGDDVIEEIKSLATENAELRQRITDISGDWMVVMEQRDRYRKALENIIDYECPIDQTFCEDMEAMREIAREALKCGMR